MIESYKGNKRLFWLSAVISLLLMSVFAICMFPQMASAADARVYVYPPAGGAGLSIGDTYTVNIMVENVRDLFGWECSLTFNPAVLEAQGFTEGEFLKRGGAATFFIPGTINNTAGTINAAAAARLGSVLGETGSGTLFSVTFKVIANGVSNITVASSMLLDSATPSKSISHTRENGIFDNTAPTVTTTNPANTATSVSVTANVTATFSEDMDGSTITTSTFTLYDNTASSPVSGTVNYNNSTKTATFNPSALTYSHNYTATVTTEVKDLAGNNMAANKAWSFTTTAAAPDTTPPTSFDLSSPANNSTTNNTSPTFSWSASSDSGSGLAKYQLYIDNVLNKDNISSSTTSTTPATPLTSGAHTWYVKAVDNAGNERSSTSTRNLTITTTTTHPNGTLIKGSGPEIYLLVNGKKRHIPTWEIFVSNLLRMEYVVNISNTELASYPTDTPLGFRDGMLIKSKSSPVVYVIEDAKRRAISSGAVFVALGYKWSNILVVSDTQLQYNQEGVTLLQSTPTTHPNGTLIKGSGPEIYLLVNGKKRHIPTWEIFVSNLLRMEYVVNISNTELASYPTDTPLGFRDGMLIKSKSSPVVYVIEDAKRRAISSGAVFVALGYKWSNILTVSDTQLQYNQLGDPI